MSKIRTFQHMLQYYCLRTLALLLVCILSFPAMLTPARATEKKAVLSPAVTQTVLRNTVLESNSFPNGETGSETSESKIVPTMAVTVQKSNTPDTVGISNNVLRFKYAKGDSYKRCVYLEFPLATLAAEYCDRVTMHLYAKTVEAHFPDEGEMKAYVSTAIPAVKNWANIEGMCTSQTLLRPVTSLAADSRLELDVTEQVRQALALGRESIAVILRSSRTTDAPSGANGVEFADGNYTDQTLRPYLSAVVEEADPEVQTKVACVGDSITQGSTYAVPTLQPNEKYPAQLQDLLGNKYLVGNFGVSGACMLYNADEGMSYVRQSEFTASKEFAPDVVVLMLGTNDSKASHWNSHKTEYVDNALELIKAYQELPSMPTVYIATSPTVLGSNRYGVQGEVVDREIVPLQKQIAQIANCGYIDVHGATKDATSTQFPDNVHGNKNGYALIARAVQVGITTRPMTQAPGIATVGAVSCTTLTGVQPDLPGFVPVTYGDATTGIGAVEAWDLDGVTFAETGVVTIHGRLKGLNMETTAFIHVQQSNETVTGVYPISGDTYLQGGKHAFLPPEKYTSPDYLANQIRIKNSNNANTQEYTRHGYLVCDISALGEQFQTAQLVLFIESIEAEWNGTDVSVLEEPSTVDLATITWNQAVAWNSEKLCTLTRADIRDNVAYLDITAAVHAARDAGESKIVLKLLNPTPATGNGINFSSSRAADGSRHPYLRTIRTEISRIDTLELSTVIGTAPSLPERIEVALGGGGTRKESVTWDAVSPTLYAGVGSFTVMGRLDNFDLAVKANVQVTLPVGYSGTTYYISNSGSDKNDGLTPSTAWQTLEKVNNHTAFLPDDKILLKRGDSWNGYLRPLGSGAEGAPITLGSYGEGNRPLINGGGTKYATYSATVMLTNQEHWIIEGLEITNYGVGQAAGTRYTEPYVRAGIYVFIHDQENLKQGYVIRDCYVHDVVSNTTDSVANASAKMSGGIIILSEYRTPEGINVMKGPNNQAKFKNVEVYNNIVLRTMHEGIRTKVEAPTWPNYPQNASGVHIHDNYIEKTLGDGIVVGESSGDVMVERNIVNSAAYYNLNSIYYAAVWAHCAKGTVFQYNEVYGTRFGQADSEAFDADTNCENTVFQYNYTHNNWGGICLFMPTQKNSVYRYNISANDGWGSGEELFNDHSTNATSLTAQVPAIYNNTIYVDKNSGTNLFGSTTNKEFVNFCNNIILAADSTKTLKFAKSTVNTNSIIKNNIFSHEGLFTARLPHSKETLEANGNFFVDPKLRAPSVTADHDRISFATMGGLSGVEGLLTNPVATLREHVSIFTPADDSPAVEAGIKMEGNTLTEDVMGSSIDAEHPTIGAIEVAAPPS